LQQIANCRDASRLAAGLFATAMNELRHAFSTPRLVRRFGSQRRNPGQTPKRRSRSSAFPVIIRNRQCPLPTLTNDPVSVFLRIRN
jgi:hypothetical protein